MKIKDNCIVRNVCGEYIVVRQGVLNADMTQVISLNETAVDIWKNFEGKDFEIEDVASYLFENYEVDIETALSDAQKWAKPLIAGKVIEC